MYLYLFNLTDKEPVQMLNEILQDANITMRKVSFYSCVFYVISLGSIMDQINMFNIFLKGCTI